LNVIIIRCERDAQQGTDSGGYAPTAAHAARASTTAAAAAAARQADINICGAIAIAAGPTGAASAAKSPCSATHI